MVLTKFQVTLGILFLFYELDGGVFITLEWIKVCEILISSRYLLSNIICSLCLGGDSLVTVAVFEKYKLLSIVSSTSEHKWYKCISKNVNICGASFFKLHFLKQFSGIWV